MRIKKKGENDMTHTIPLCALQPGECAQVFCLYTDGSMRRRLLDIGLIPGTCVECIGRSPGGDPTAYRIRQAVMAIRQEDAAHIQVIPINEREDAPWG